jgi:hypothetical protein
MRNTVEYPVDAEEAASALALMAADFPKELIGDMRPYILALVASYVLAHKADFDKFAKETG